MLKMQIQYQIIILYGIHHIPLLEGNLLLPNKKHHKVASGYKAFIENFPNDIQTVIKEMLLLASPLYYKNHKS